MMAKAKGFKPGDIVQSAECKVFVTGEGDPKIGYDCFAGILMEKDGTEDWPLGMFSDTWTLDAFEKVKKVNGNKLIKAIFKKAAKWDALHEEISEYYIEEGEEGYDPMKDEIGLLGIGEVAASAFGYL
jgi:hypothetical protein